MIHRRYRTFLAGALALSAVTAAAQPAPTPMTLRLQSDEVQTAWCNFMQPVVSFTHEVYLLAGTDADPQDLISASGQNGPRAIFQADPQLTDAGNQYQVHINAVLAPVTPFAGTPTPDRRDCDWLVPIRGSQFSTPTPTATPGS